MTVAYKFAWLPCYMRKEKRWVWLRRYTKVYRWSTRENRLVTFWTSLGHNPHDIIPIVTGKHNERLYWQNER